MFRVFLALLAIAPLAACGGKDFEVPVDASSDRVASELKKLDPNTVTRGAGVLSVRSEQLADGSLRYILPNPSGSDGEVLFELNSESERRTKIDVAVDLPFVTRETAGGTEYLSESEIEKALRSAMRGWDKDIEKGRSTSGSAQEISEVISIAAIGLQDFDKFEELATTALYERHLSDMARAEWNATTADWGSGGDSAGETTWAYDSEAQDDYVDDDETVEGGGWGSDSY